MMEIIMLGNFTMILLLIRLGLKGADDEDDKGTRKVLLALYNKVYRANQDIYFYIDPTSAFDILQAPMPALRAFTDLTKAINRTRLYLFDDNYNGYSPAYYWGKNIPYINQYNNLQYISTHNVAGKAIK